jgi:tetratricopeptide (TPR) repeat protein
MMSDAPNAVAAESSGGGRFLDHLASAADMVAARRFREAEVEALRALSIAPADLRALKLLGLVRFKLGRLDEARTVCRELAAASPDDAGIRLNLGLIALKLGRVDESVSELELAAALAPDDARPWSYLGFAYARRGERARAAAAFRRVGQDALAIEAESGAGDAAGAAVDSAFTGGDAAFASGDAAFASGNAAFERSVPVEAREPRTDPNPADPPRDRLARDLTAGEAEVPAPVAMSLGAYVASRLAPADAYARWAHSGWNGSPTALLAIGDAMFVRGDVALACRGAALAEPAHGHGGGRATSDRLGGDDGPFFRLSGPGDLLVGAPIGRVVPLRLEDDAFHVREDRVLAFDGALSWEGLRIPRAGLRLLRFRGRGVVAILADDQPGAIRVKPDHPVRVSVAHVLGWAGRIAARDRNDGDSDDSERGAGDDASSDPFGVVCEGEGVVLLDVRARS